MFPVPPPPAFPYHIYAPGFPVEKRDNVMAAYRREERAWQRQFCTGLGLAAVLQIAFVVAVCSVSSIGFKVAFDAIILLSGR